MSVLLTATAATIRNQATLTEVSICTHRDLAFYASYECSRRVLPTRSLSGGQSSVLRTTSHFDSKKDDPISLAKHHASVECLLVTPDTFPSQQPSLSALNRHNPNDGMDQQ